MCREEKAQSIRGKYKDLALLFNERTRGCWAATEAKVLGRVGITIVSQATGIDAKTIRAGIAELDNPEQAADPERIRRAGAGRKKLTETDPELIWELNVLIEPGTRGDPESPLKWTLKSTTSLADTLTHKGHRVSQRSVCTLLSEQGYSLQSHRKSQEGTDHPDRDAQFHYISASTQRMQRKNQPVISVDTKKKELIGNFKNPGQEWRPKGNPRQVNMHDFADKKLGKVIPYGVYDLAKNEGWMNVGIEHDTASFAVESIRRWWKRLGRKRYPKAHELLITADCGGANGNRNKLWKVELQELADQSGLMIHVRHFPPGTSKWNKIEHRLFSFISQNWKGTPLLSRATVVNLIANTKTHTGLQVYACLDENTYETGKKVSDKAMESLNLLRESFHGEWNYRIAPRRHK